MVDEMTHNNSDANDSVILGMAALLPGAYSLPLYWSNLCDKAHVITKLSRAKLPAMQGHKE
jgi:acyl transferase domain-containing protein